MKVASVIRLVTSLVLSSISQSASLITFTLEEQRCKVWKDFIAFWFLLSTANETISSLYVIIRSKLYDKPFVAPGGKRESKYYENKS